MARLPFLGLPIGGVAAERARDRKFPQLVTHHVLSDEHGNVLPSIVYRDGQTQHVRNYHGTARPRLDWPLAINRDSRIHLFEQVGIDKRTLLD